MYADRAAAFGAGPSRFFVFYEFPNSKPSDIFKVLDHAHGIVGPVSFIQMLQALTGEFFTLKTKG